MMLKALLKAIKPLFRRKSVGGINESVLEADEKKKGKKKDGDVLQPDPPAGGVVLAADLPPASAAPVLPSLPPAVEVSKSEIKPPKPAVASAAPPPEGIPRQYQSIRQHVSGGQVHLHDDDNKLKVAIPVAEWYVIVRQLKTMTPYTYVDTDFNCTAIFRPFMHDGYFEIAIEMVPVTVGDRFKQLASLIKR